jgi:hypothetical protein
MSDFRCRRTLFWAFALTYAAACYSSNAEANITSSLQNCAGSGSGPPTYFVAGQPVVVTICRSGVPAPYLGTYSFSSADPTVIPPPSYTYTVADNRLHTSSFGNWWSAQHSSSPMVVFTAPGRRKLTYDLSDGGGVAGYSSGFEVDVIALEVPTPEGVPTLAPALYLALGALLVLVARYRLTSR